MFFEMDLFHFFHSGKWTTICGPHVSYVAEAAMILSIKVEYVTFKQTCILIATNIYTNMIYTNITYTNITTTNNNCIALRYVII